ncbi:MAG: PD-(D/E)XK nuclease family transposase [Clostridia bacterium]|nr:PD-(D/E)XK nuclease family transposase [Clostridia bacterium]
MKGCVSEYQNCSIRDIAERYIEGEPQISGTPVHAGDADSRIHGLDTADKSRREHTTLYDILFYAVLPDSSEKIGLFINVEAQNRYNPGYPLIKRGIYYCSRMLSAQFGRDFADGQYDKLKKVYSIWICANAPDSRDNTITRYSLAEEMLLGTAAEEQKNYDLLSVVMVCFNDRQIEKRLQGGMEGKDSADLVRLLSVLLSSAVETEEKKQILEEEYSIPMTREIESEVSHMCNLSQGLIEKGVAKGIAQGISQGIAQGADKRNMEIAAELLKMAMPAASILKVTGISMDQLRKIAEETGLSLTE